MLDESGQGSLIKQPGPRTRKERLMLSLKITEAKLPNVACKANERLIPEAAVLRVNQIK